jgi:transposase
MKSKELMEKQWEFIKPPLCCIPINERNRKNPEWGRPFAFDEETYAKRSGIERIFKWIKMGFRSLIIRYEPI